VDLRLLPQQQLKVTPKQIAANYILQLSSMELQDVINAELQDNPALDLEETQVCPLCGEPLQGRICLSCFGLANKPPRGDEPEGEPLEGTSLTQRDEDDEEFDPIVRAEAEQTLAEYLSWNVRVMLPARLHPTAEYLIGNINDNGRLEGVTLEDAARLTKVSLADAERVLKTIMSIEPWGVGARDTRECLLAQMEHLEEVGEAVPAHAKQIVSEQLRALGEHKYGDIAQALRITRDEVEQAGDYIKESLNPFPAHGFAAGHGGASVGGREVGLRPDVIILKDEDAQFRVEVIESRRFSLRVNPVYRQLVAQVRHREVRQQHRGVLRHVLAQPARVEVVVVQVRDIEVLGAPELRRIRRRAERGVVGEREPRGEVGRGEPRVAEDPAGGRLHQHPGVTDRRDAHRSNLSQL